MDTEQAGNRIEIATRTNGVNSGGDALTTDYEITVPVETELQVRTDSGNVTVDSVHGDMSFDTVGADVALQDVDGYLMIKTIGGSLVCTRCAGRLDANSISGNFQLVQPVMDNVRVQTSSGNILFDGGFLEPWHLRPEELQRHHRSSLLQPRFLRCQRHLALRQCHQPGPRGSRQAPDARAPILQCDGQEPLRIDERWPC